MTIQYITVSRVKEALPSSYNGSDDAVLYNILTSCCAWLDNYCGRANGGFAVQTYDELYNGSGEKLMFLRNTPIQSISRVSTVVLPALLIRNTDGDNSARALIQIIGDPDNPWNLNSQANSIGVTLTYIKNAVTTTATLLWADYPTVNDLVSAINGLGSNWNANVQGGFGGWSTTDLRATMGSFGVRITIGYLWIHWFDIPWFRQNENTGELYAPMGFTRGILNWRITYTAGFTTFPDDLTQALAELVTSTYYARAINPNTETQNIDGAYNYKQLGDKFKGLSWMAQKCINSYKIRTVRQYSEW